MFSMAKRISLKTFESGAAALCPCPLASGDLRARGPAPVYALPGAVSHCGLALACLGHRYGSAGPGSFGQSVWQHDTVGFVFDRLEHRTIHMFGVIIIGQPSHRKADPERVEG